MSNIHSQDIFQTSFCKIPHFFVLRNFFLENKLSLFNSHESQVFLLASPPSDRNNPFREILIFSKTPLRQQLLFFCYGKWFFFFIPFMNNIDIVLYFTNNNCFFLIPPTVSTSSSHRSPFRKVVGVEYTLRHAIVLNFVILNGIVLFLGATSYQGLFSSKQQAPSVCSPLRGYADQNRLKSVTSDSSAAFFN